MALSATPRPTSPLEEDLARRDLTINAMAQTADGDIIDPTTARTTCAPACCATSARPFAEDPVRILAPGALPPAIRLCRGGGNRALMQQMVADGEVDALVAERVCGKNWPTWPDGNHALSHVHRAARLRRAGAHPRKSTRCGACRNAPTTT